MQDRDSKIIPPASGSVSRLSKRKVALLSVALRESLGKTLVSSYPKRSVNSPVVMDLPMAPMSTPAALPR